MLTMDRQIDRRILLGADSLEGDGWNVSIISMPCNVEEETQCREVIRLQRSNAGDSGEKQSSFKNRLLMRGYQVLKSMLSYDCRLTFYIKTFIRTYLFSPVSFYSRLYLEKLDSMRFDILVANDLPMLPVACRAASRTGAKVVYDSHELFVEQQLSAAELKRWRSAERKYISQCDAVITVNPSIASELQNRYQIADVSVVYNAEKTDFEVYPKKCNLFHQAFELPAESKIVLLQGGLSEGRNLLILVKAFVHIKDKNIHLVYLGNGSELDKLKYKANEYSILPNVHFLPAVSQEDLADYTKSADLGVIPYTGNCLNNYYCTPNKMFEFVASGLPIVASNLPEIKKIVADNNIGIVVDSSSEQEIAVAIEQIFTSDESYLGYKNRVLELRKTLNWQNEGEKLVSLYRRLA